MTDNSEVLRYERPDGDALSKSAAVMLATAQNIKISSQRGLELATEEMNKIVRKRQDLEAKRKAITDPMEKAKKAVMDLFRPATTALEQAEGIIKRAIGTYTMEQRRLAAEQQAAAERAAAAEREAKAREAAAAEAESARLLAESNAQQLADAPLASQATYDAALAAAGRAAELATESRTIVAPQVAPTVVVKNAQVRTRWKARVTNKLELVKHCAANPQFLPLLDLNESGLNKMASALEGAFNVPGCEAYEEPIVAAGRRS